MLSFNKNAEFGAPSSTLPCSSSRINFWSLVCWVLFFSQKGSTLFCIDLCSTDFSLRKLWAPLRQPCNLNFPGSQSPWELQHVFNLAAPSARLLTAALLSPGSLPGSTYSLWMLEMMVVRLSAVVLGLLLWDWDKLLQDKKKEFTFWCTAGK